MSTIDFEDLPIGEAWELENKMAYGTGNFLVKVWFESSKIGCRIADLVQAFKNLNEARENSKFLKDMKGVDACYIIRLKPYKLIEKVILFPSDRLTNVAKPKL